MRLNAPVVGIAELRGLHGYGYLLATADGKVFPFGPAPSYGDVSRLHLRAPIAGISTDGTAYDQPDGYYLFGTDGGVFAFGRAPFRGSLGGRPLHAPITAMGIQTVPVPMPGFLK